MTEHFHRFTWVIFSRNFAYAKFHENKTLVKISQFTVLESSHFAKVCIKESTVLKDFFFANSVKSKFAELKIRH